MMRILLLAGVAVFGLSGSASAQLCPGGLLNPNNIRLGTGACGVALGSDLAAEVTARGAAVAAEVASRAAAIAAEATTARAAEAAAQATANGAISSGALTAEAATARAAESVNATAITAEAVTARAAEAAAQTAANAAATTSSVTVAVATETTRATTAEGTKQIYGSGFLTARVVTAAGAITALATDGIIVVNKATGAATPITLEASPATGAVHIVKDGKGDAQTNNITITPASGTIDGSPNIIINQNRAAVTLIFAGAEWSIL